MLLISVQTLLFMECVLLADAQMLMVYDDMLVLKTQMLLLPECVLLLNAQMLLFAVQNALTQTS